MKTRTFVALSINRDIRSGAATAMARLRSAADSFRWVEEENLHYTLHFLGDLADTEVVQTCDAVGQVAAETTAFRLGAQGVGAFPTVDRPRTLWLGVGKGNEQMIALYDALDQRFAQLGFRGEVRSFVPHMTLGKLNRQGKLPGEALSAELAALATMEAGTMQVEEITVFASELTREGPAYHVLSRAKLSG